MYACVCVRGRTCGLSPMPQTYMFKRSFVRLAPAAAGCINERSSPVCDGSACRRTMQNVNVNGIV